MAIERVKPADTNRRAELTELRALAQKAVQNSTCHFSKLPVEIATAVFDMVIEESNTVMLRLMSVCRAWRELVVDTPAFWGRLTITGNSRQKKIDTWLDRSRGRLSLLHLSETFDLNARPNTFRAVPPTFWSNLRGLQLDHTRPSRTKKLPVGVTASLRIRILRVGDASHETGFDSNLEILDTSTLEEFSFSTTVGKLPSNFTQSCKNVVRLHLKTPCLKYAELCPVLESVCKLESLAIHRLIFIDNDLSLDCLEHLVHLRRLDIWGYHLQGRWSSLTRLPKLEALTIANGDDNAKAGSEDRATSLTLKELRFSGFRLSQSNVVRLLEQCPSLSSLSIRGGDVVLRPGSGNPILDRLADTDNMVCPRLEHLEWCSSQTVKAGPVVRIIKARSTASPDAGTPSSADDQPSQAPSFALDDTLPLRTLILDDCTLMDPEAIPWLRSKVPVFSCKVLKKQSRIQRYVREICLP